MDQSPPSAGFSQPPLHALVVPEPRKKRPFVRFLLTLLVLGFLGSVAVNFLFVVVGLGSLVSADDEGRVVEKHFALNRHGADKVAILSIEGTILGGEGFFKQQIDHARKDIEDGRLKAIVLRVNSPGGTISGSDYMLHHLRRLVAESGKAKIPIVVSMGGLAASGGYYVSMCVGDTPNSIFAEPSTWTGSIGVIIPHYNVEDLMQKWGIQEDAVVSHHLKEMGSITKKMTPEERDIFQKLVNDGFTQFKDVIKQGRPKFRDDPAALDKLATGQIFTATQAKKNGLVDEIGFVEAAIDRAIQLAGLNRDNVDVVKYKAEPRLSDILFGQSRVQPSLDMAALLETATPRAYYLYAGVSSLVGGEK